MQLTPRDLSILRAGAPRRTIRGRNGTKADLFVHDSVAGPIAIKDYSARRFWIRHTLGRWLVRRETRAHAAAAGIEGLPRFLGRIGPYGLATAWIEARPLSDFGDGEVDPARFDRLEKIVRGLHERRIALADLKHRDVLLGDDGAVWVVDLAMASVGGIAFEHFRQSDLFTLTRLRSRFAVDRPPIDFDVAPSAVAWHRRARRIKWVWDRFRGAERLPPIDDHWRF